MYLLYLRAVSFLINDLEFESWEWKKFSLGDPYSLQEGL